MDSQEKPKMDKLSPQKNPASPDIVEENIAKLRELFPEAFTEGSDDDGSRWKVDFDALKEILGSYTEDKSERYSFTWNGKSKARMIAQTPSTGTLRPCKEESVEWDSTQNIFIEGDNLEVLKLLQKSYHKKIKMIYIDPPYNTGKDFIYPDDYKDNLQTYLRYTGQVDEEGFKVSTNAETSGRYHTNWLNMMYPRLKLARNLLRDDGVIFVSIDDTEESNLKKICNEIFGEENYLANSIWERSFSPINLKKHFSVSHDYIICYAKNIEECFCNGLNRKENIPQGYSNPDNDPRGVWTSGDISVGPVVKERVYEIITPSGRIVLPPNGYCWRLTKDRLLELDKDNRIWYGKDGSNVPRIKRFLTEVKQTITPMTIWKYEDVGHSQDAKQRLKDIFEGKSYYDYPKPIGLIERCIQLYSNEDAIILDFFAGSATTAHATMKYNAEEGGNRKFIMVQLPEPCDEESDAFTAGYETIADIGKERIRRAAAKIREEHPDYDGDLGFKVFKLDSSNIKPWEGDFDTLEKDLVDAIENIKPEREDEDILYEVLLKYGLDLAVPIEERKIAGKTVYIIGAGALVVCLDKNEITLEVVEGIAELKRELEPEIMRVVFRDSGFASDVVKTNAVQILKQAEIEDVRSI